jgi:hypothetical protein
VLISFHNGKSHEMKGRLMSYSEMSPNQIRVAIDVRQTFDAWREARNSLRQYAGGMFWKKSGGHEYLVKVINRTGGNKSLGRRSVETERILAEFTAGKARAKARMAALTRSVQEFAGMSAGIGINRVPAVVSATLRKLDEFGLLGKNLMVIGTNAM